MNTYYLASFVSFAVASAICDDVAKRGFPATLELIGGGRAKISTSAPLEIIKECVFLRVVIAF